MANCSQTFWATQRSPVFFWGLLYTLWVTPGKSFHLSVPVFPQCKTWSITAALQRAKLKVHHGRRWWYCREELQSLSSTPWTLNSGSEILQILTNTKEAENKTDFKSSGREAKTQSQYLPSNERAPLSTNLIHIQLFLVLYSRNVSVGKHHHLERKIKIP